MKAAKQRDTRQIAVAIRFWFGGKACRLVVKPGETYRFHEHRRTDEGWQSEDAVISLNNRQLVQFWVNAGRDCDGLLRESGELRCPVHRRAAIKPSANCNEKPLRHRYPAWESISSDRYDESAVAMGY